MGKLAGLALAAIAPILAGIAEAWIERLPWGRPTVASPRNDFGYPCHGASE